MKITFIARKGFRVKSYGFAGMQCREDGIWWSEKDKQWIQTNDIEGQYHITNIKPCRSVKAFRRALKEAETYLPTNTRFILWGGPFTESVYGKI
jgi:hypothetical protein